ncbi:MULTISPECIES: SMP-30/gluconolactonase/LRE family protein [unclassified Micromonospora]|uniref:SMP-30/gluconolactonase/LRE family protein n=1 Tax=unclassified Micromonospora TaxID=2617518 RepID=UPI001C5DB47E|nr:hypothetical protein [Micromonospora sp. RL09-050-HVF-A]MBW4705492.1 hypothetical protein [Micromonospora sp. RL09-050-HVF-A]
MRRRILTLAVAAAAAGALAVPSAVPASAGVPASAVTPARSAPAARIAVHFDLTRGQLPENITLGPDGTAYLTFAAARQVAAVDPAGRTRVLATLAAPADGGVATPVLGFALTSGIVRTDDGTIYVLYASGDAASTGLYRIPPGQTPRRIAALPADGLPNGLALDPTSRTFYVTDSVRGTISTVPLAGGPARVWSSASALAPTGFLGVNGVKVRGGAVWATNLDQGTLLRIPLRAGRPGAVEVRATGLVGIDDFAFAPDGRVVAALNGPNTVVGIDHDGRTRTLLTGADGLQNPTSVAVRGHTVLVASAAYVTATDPNLIVATLRHR